MDDVARVLQLWDRRDAPRAGPPAARVDSKRPAGSPRPMADRGGALHSGAVSADSDEAGRHLRAWRVRAGGHHSFTHCVLAGERCADAWKVENISFISAPALSWSACMLLDGRAPGTALSRHADTI